MIFNDNRRLLGSTTIGGAEDNLVYYVLLCCAGQSVKERQEQVEITLNTCYRVVPNLVLPSDIGS
jgi:hypothetical protein